MFVREVVATSDLYQTVKIKSKLLRPLLSDHQNLTYFVPFMSRLKLLSSHSFSIRDCEQCSFINFFWSFPLEGVDRWEKDIYFLGEIWLIWCKERSSRTNDSTPFSFYPAQIVLNLYFYQTILKICICWPGSEKGEINRKNFSHFLPPWRLRRGSKESLSLPPCIKSPDVWLGRYRMGLSSSHDDHVWKINTNSSHVSLGIIIVSVKNFYTLNIANGTTDRRHCVLWLIFHL